MRLTATVLLMFAVIASCSDKKSIPAGILSTKKMQAVLSDILLADALNVERCARDTSLKLQKENASYFLKIYRIHKTDSGQFNRSYNFYLKRPDLLKEISDTIVNVLNRNSSKPLPSTDSTKKKLNGRNFKKTPG